MAFFGCVDHISVTTSRLHNFAFLLLQVQQTADGQEGAAVMYDGTLSVTTKSRDPLSQGTQKQTDGGKVLPVGSVGKYSLRVYVDKSVIEAHMNGRRSITARFYPLDMSPLTGAFGLKVCNDAATAAMIDSIEVWGMQSIYSHASL